MAAQSPIVYLTCPACGTPIREPFSRTSGPVPFTHRTKQHGSRRSCRLIVTPDPTGNRHSVHKVPPEKRFEDLLIVLLRAA